jgi:hypothetical protein
VQTIRASVRIERLHKSDQSTDKDEDPNSSTHDPSSPTRLAVVNQPCSGLSSPDKEEESVDGDHKCPNRRAHNTPNKPNSLKVTVSPSNERVGRQVANNKETGETLNEVYIRKFPVPR